MNLPNLHAEIAKERFLDLMANGEAASPIDAAEIAFLHANAFMQTYRPFEIQERKMKGCPQCFGSGGKKSDPCKFCNGTGRVLA